MTGIGLISTGHNHRFNQPRISRAVNAKIPTTNVCFWHKADIAIALGIGISLD
jgi:hypothetical protein